MGGQPLDGVGSPPIPPMLGSPERQQYFDIFYLKDLCAFSFRYAKLLYKTKRKGIKVLKIEKDIHILTFSIGRTFVPFLLEYAKLFYVTKRKGIKVVAIEKGNNILTFSIGRTFVPFLLEYAQLFL